MHGNENRISICKLSEIWRSICNFYEEIQPFSTFHPKNLTLFKLCEYAGASYVKIPLDMSAFNDVVFSNFVENNSSDKEWGHCVRCI
jgi:hypothetical protein